MRHSLVLLLFAAAPLAAAPPAWEVDESESFIHFTAEQAGAKFEGEFARFDADIRFDPDALEASCAEVRVDITSIGTQNAERDDILSTPAWFDTAEHETASYRAEHFRDGEGGFVADGMLTIKGVEVSAPLHFKLTTMADRVVLTGSTRLDRLALELGTGEWQDTTWIGQFVTVNVRIEAKVSGDGGDHVQPHAESR